MKAWWVAQVAYVREYWLLILLMGGSLAYLGYAFDLSAGVVFAIGLLIDGVCSMIMEARKPGLQGLPDATTSL